MYKLKLPVLNYFITASLLIQWIELGIFRDRIPGEKLKGMGD